MLTNRNRARSNRSQNRRGGRIENSLTQLERVQNTILRDLKWGTVDRSPPAIPDVQPMRRSPRPQIHTFEVTVDKGFVTASNAGDSGALSFALSDVPSPTDFTSLFDQYRIAQVRVEFIPVTSSLGPSTTATELPYLTAAIDYDDSTAPTLGSIRQYGTATTSSISDYIQRVLNPRITQAVYSGAFTSFALAPYGTWIDSASPGVLHYGLKWATTPVTTVSGTFLLMALVCHYTIQCKNNI
jgi:hypothetical protein